MMFPVLARAVAPRTRDFLGAHKLARNGGAKEAFHRRVAETPGNPPENRLEDGRTGLKFHAPGQE
jgi:hypothetical protein